MFTRPYEVFVLLASGHHCHHREDSLAGPAERITRFSVLCESHSLDGWHSLESLSPEETVLRLTLLRSASLCFSSFVLCREPSEVSSRKPSILLSSIPDGLPLRTWIFRPLRRFFQIEELRPAVTCPSPLKVRWSASMALYDLAKLRPFFSRPDHQVTASFRKPLR